MVDWSSLRSVWQSHLIAPTWFTWTYIRFVAGYTHRAKVILIDGNWNRLERWRKQHLIMDEQHLDSVELASFFSRASRGEIFPAVRIPLLISASETLLFTLDAIIPKSVNVACTVSSDLYRGSRILRGISMRMRRYKTMSQSFRPFSTNNFHFQRLDCGFFCEFLFIQREKREPRDT